MRYLSIMLIIITLSATVAAQTQPPDAGFEQWKNNNEPQRWNGIVINLIFTKLYTLEKTTDAHSGSFAAKLVNKNIAGQIVPGMISLGKPDFVARTIKGAAPISAQPSKLRGYYKYNGVGGDTMAVIVAMFKYNTLLHKRDTIGFGVFFTSQSTATYQPFDAYVVYARNQVPDSVNIIVTSSGFAGHEGSYAIIDDLAFEYGDLILPPTAMPATSVQKTSFVARWQPIQRATNYRVTVARDSLFNDTLTGWVFRKTGKVDSIVVNDLMLDTDYYYNVQAIYPESPSWVSNAIRVHTRALFAAPLLTADSVFINKTKLSFNTLQQATRYKLQVAADSLFSHIFTEFDTTNNTVFINNLTSNTRYFARVRGYNTEGNGDWSSTLSFTTKYLAKPRNISIDNPTQGSIRCRWSKVPDADSYSLIFSVCVQDTSFYTSDTIIEFVPHDIYMDAHCSVVIKAYNEWGESDTTIFNTTGAVEQTQLINVKLRYQYNQLFLTSQQPIPDGQLTITNILGRELYRYKMKTITHEAIPVALPQGLYIVHLVSNNKYFVQKIMVAD